MDDSSSDIVEPLDPHFLDELKHLMNDND